MQWKDVESALPGGLKLLGAALTATGVGAPVGVAVAGIGALVGHALGVDGSDPEAVLNAVKMDPQAAEKLMEVQENAKAQLQQLVVQQAVAQMQSETAQQQAVLSDKASARSRDTEIIKAGKMNWRADVMLAGAFLGIIVIAALLASGQVKEASAIGTFLIMAGTKLLGNVGTAFDFEFGSSRSSLEKTELLAKAPAIKVDTP